MTPLTAHRARVLLHRVTLARTFADLLAIGDDLGIPRHQPVALWLRAFRWRVAMMHAVVGTVAYRAGSLRIPAN